MATSTIVTIAGKHIELDDLDKVFYPATGFTKADMIDYYRRTARYILPHLAGRPVILRRCPDGVAGEFSYEKTFPGRRPDWMNTSGGQDTKRKGFCLIDGPPTLVWIVNRAAVELHTPLARVDDLSRPTAATFHLTPNPPATLLDCCRIAIILRDMLKGLGLHSFVKTSGGRGLHLFLPLNTSVTYDRTAEFARAVVETVQRHYGGHVVDKATHALRAGKVLIDWNQNTGHKTAICAYSLLANPQPTVSTPVRWEEVDEAVRNRDADALVFTADRVLARLPTEGDPFAPVLTMRQRLPISLDETGTARAVSVEACRQSLQAAFARSGQ